jgi:TolB-like protein
LAGDPGEDYFSDGITEDIITDLSKVSGLSVISRHSTFVYKGRSVAARDIGEDLGARYLVEGSIRRSGGTVRVTAQLIDAQNDSHLWAERYDREIEDVFSVQDEVSGLIVDALNVKLTDAERRRLGHNGTRNQSAHDLLLRAMEQFYTFTPENVVGAVDLLSECVAIDPAYANAQAWHARALLYSAVAGLSSSPTETIGSAVEQARNAVSTDPLLPHAHAVLGWGSLWAGEGKDALEETAAAVELDGNFADGYLWHAMTQCSNGLGESSLQTIERGIELNPHYSVTYLHAVALSHFALGEFEEVLVQCQRVSRRNPDFLPNHFLKIATLGHLGRSDEAGLVVSLARKLDPDGISVLPGFFAEPDLHDAYNKGLRSAGL